MKLNGDPGTSLDSVLEEVAQANQEISHLDEVPIDFRVCESLIYKLAEFRLDLYTAVTKVPACS